MALVVAAVVPILGVFLVVGFLLPTQLERREGERLTVAATAASSLLARECEAVGDRAALVVSQLLLRVSLGDPRQDSVALVRAEAGRVLDGLDDGPGDGAWTVVVLDDRGTPVAWTPQEPEVVEDDVQALRALDCSTGAVGDPARVGVVLPFRNQEASGEVVVAAPLDDTAVAALVDQVGLEEAAFAVVADGRVVGTAGPSPVGGEEEDEDDTTAKQETARAELVADVDRVSDVPGVAVTDVGDQRAALTPTALPGVTVAAVGAAPPYVDRALAIAFVVSAFGTGALVWFLSATLTRPLTELGELARRIAAGDDVAQDVTTQTAADADADVKGVSAVLGSLARDLRASEADATRRRGAFLDAFSRFGDALQQTHDRDGLLQTVLQAALLAAEAPMGLALHHDRSSRLSRRELSLRARTRDDGPTTLDDLTRRTLSEVAERALRERTIVELPGTDERGPVLAVPLGSTSRPLGAVVVARDVGAPGYDAVAFEAIGALATNAGTALANIKDHQEVERLSVTDPLTGVNNFRHLSTMLAREMERATRFGHPLGVLMLDIDRFKPVNDTYGHAAGDAVLRELARRVKECVREVDTVARYGGEEFALLLPETDLDGAERLGGRVLAAIRSEPFRLPDGTVLAITASMGVAGFPQHGDTATEVMRRADEALYRAKDGGRDRVEVARTSEEATAGSAVGPGPGLGSPDGDRAP